MIALAFMACNQNSPELPKDEQKAAVLVSDSAFSLINQPLTTVHKALLDAGYKYVDPSKAADLPKRIFKDVITDENRSYVMGMDPDSLESNAGTMYELNKAMKAGKNVEMVTVHFVDGKCVRIMTQIVVPVDFNVTEFFLNRTKAMSGALEAMPLKNFLWEGEVRTSDKKERAQYMQRDKYEAAVKGKKGIEVNEAATNIEYEPVKGFGFHASLYVLSEEEEKEMNDAIKDHPGELMIIPYNVCDFIAADAQYIL